MQKTILRPNIPKSDGVEFRSSYRPVQGLYCGGDYYDVIVVGADRYLVLIGDVAGHGVKAAFVTGILKAIIYPEYIRSIIGKEFSPGAFLSWLNERMNFEFRSTSNMLITFFAGVLDMKKMIFNYANAGHDHPFIIRSGKCTELPVSGTSIGVVKSITYSEQVVRVSSGDLLLLYTDGLVEINCQSDRNPIKLRPLLEKVETGDDYHRRLFAAALEDASAKNFDDDVTILTVRIL